MPDLAATAAAAAQFFAGAFGGLALLGIGHALASAAALSRREAEQLRELPARRQAVEGRLLERIAHGARFSRRRNARR